MIKILVTCPPMLKRIHEYTNLFHEKNIELVTPNIVQILSEEELMQLVPEVDGWIIGDDPATRKVFEKGKSGKLKAAVKWGVGVDNVDFNACKILNIPITNTPQVFGDEVADIAIAYLLGLARDTYWIDREVRKGNWIKPTGVSISGKNIAVIGLGDIGQSLIKRLKGFDVHIIAYDPFSNLNADELGINAILEFPNRIDEADFVILTCALTPSSREMINSNSIAKMKKGVRIINVSRGPLINENDLIKALDNEWVKSVALDVFEEEPIKTTNKLMKYSNCILGSHNGSNTIEAVDRATLKAIEHLFNFLNIK